MLQKYLLILISAFSLLGFVSCNDNPTQTKGTSLTANAGHDQTIIAGSYAVFDPTGSTGNYSWYEWVQDEKNPQKVKIFSISKEKNNRWNIRRIVFTKEGIYKFILYVKVEYHLGTENSYGISQADTLTITVKPNLSPKFEDLNLEAIVRAKLNMQVEELSDNALLSLDSLSSSEVLPQEKIKSVKGIEKCTNLIFLGLSLQSISDVSPMASLKKLRYLHLDQNYIINDIYPLSELTEMEDLNINSNLITNIAPLRKMTKLKYLDCCYSSISDISAVENMKELIELWFSFTSIKDLTPVSNLNKLECLWLADCNISDISCLKGLINLKVLKIAFNNISDISVLANFHKLELLYMEKNNVADISSLKNLPNLFIVRLWDNMITDIEPLVKNTYFSTGDIILLTGNPLSEKTINEYIPILQSRGITVYW